MTTEELIKRLREGYPFVGAYTDAAEADANLAADLIEQQAEKLRIAEEALNAANEWFVLELTGYDPRVTCNGMVNITVKALAKLREE